MAQNTIASNNHQWMNFQSDIYTSNTVLSFKDGFHVNDLEERARKKFTNENNMGAFDYVFGSAGRSSTERANRASFNKYKIIPRMLNSTRPVNIGTQLFGQSLPSPLLLAPIGVQSLVLPDGELASAKAASALNIPYIMSSASSSPIESVAQANASGPRWFQLYWPVHENVTKSVLTRAKNSGFTVLVVTLDTFSLGWRPNDLNHAFNPFVHGTGTSVGFSDPEFMALHNQKPTSQSMPYPCNPAQIKQNAENGNEFDQLRMRLGGEWIKEFTSGKMRSWEDLAIIKKYWDGPIVLKGIQHVLDAEMAVDLVDGIIVSNHGGRQVDGAVASIDALYKIGRSHKVRAAQNSGKFTVLFDSGIRSGSDIMKAIALGAQGVLCRPYMYALALGGEAGVEQIIKTILADFEITTKLSGFSTLADIWHNRNVLDLEENYIEPHQLLP